MSSYSSSRFFYPLPNSPTATTPTSVSTSASATTSPIKFRSTTTSSVPAPSVSASVPSVSSQIPQAPPADGGNKVRVEYGTANYGWLSLDIEGQLLTLFCNYCSLGQYELARACLIHLHSIDKTKALSYLKRLITSQSPKSWLNSRTVPSRAHLVWLFLTDYKRFRSSSSGVSMADFPQSVWRQVEFALLLECINNPMVELGSMFTPHLEKLIRNETGLETAKGNSSFTTPEGLKSIVLNYPVLGSFISSHLKQSQPARRISMNQCYVDIISSLLEHQKTTAPLMEEILYYFQCLSLETQSSTPLTTVGPPPVPPTPQEIEYRNSLENLFKRVLKLADLSNNSTMWRKQLYEALLTIPEGKNSALYLLLEIEESNIKKLCKNTGLPKNSASETDIVDKELPWPFLALTSTSPDRMEEFWNRFFHFIMNTSFHCLEYILMLCSSYISKQEWDKCALAIEPFPELRPLLLLLTWNQFRGNVTARTELVKLLWNSNLLGEEEDPEDKKYESFDNTNVDGLLKAKCDEMSYQIYMTWWCTKHLKLKRNGEQCTMKIGRENYTVLQLEKTSEVMLKVDTREKVQSSSNVVFSLLQETSLLFVIQSYLDSIPSKQIINIINSNPLSKSSTKIKGSMDATARDLRIVHSYYALRNLIHVLREAAAGNVDEKYLRKKLLKAEKHLMQVVAMPGSPIDTVLVLLESIFALLFLKTNAFNGSDQFDIISVLKLTKGEQETDDKFVTSILIAEYVFNLIRKILLELSTHPSAENPETLLHKRLSKFNTILQEAEWRHSLVKNLFYTSSLTPAPFWNLMLATPETLLIMCIQEKNWQFARDVIKYFKMEKFHVELANRAEAYYLVRKKMIEDSSSISIDTLIPGISNSLTKFLICMDISVTMATNGSQCSFFIEKAKQLLNSPSFLQDLREAYDSSQNPSLKYYPVLLSQYLKRLEMLINDPYTAGSLIDIFTGLESYPLNDVFLKNCLNARSSLKRGKSILIKRVNSKIPSEDSSIVINNVLSLVSSTNVDLTSPFFNFVQHIQRIGSSLVKTNSAENRDYFLHLDKSPTSILSKMVFISKDHIGAKNLSSVLNIDLVQTLLDHLDCNPKVASTSPKYPLTISEVKFIGSIDPIFAILTCFLRTPTDHFNHSLLFYALEESKNFPVLRRWVESLTRNYLVFSDVFLHNNHDNILPCLSSKSVATTSLKLNHEVILESDNLKNFVSIFNEDTLKGEEYFYSQVLSSLNSAKKQPLAVDVGDSTISTGAPQYLFPLMISNWVDKSETYSYVLRMTDTMEKARFVCQNIKYWTIEVASDLLRMARFHLKKVVDRILLVESMDENSEIALTLKEVEKLEMRMKIYKELLDAVPNAWPSWVAIHELAESDPVRLVDRLINSKEYRLARKVARKCNLASDVTLKIEEKYLYSLLLATPNTPAASPPASPSASVTEPEGDGSTNFNTVHRYLVALGGSEAIVIAQNLLSKVKANSARLFLIQFLIENHSVPIGGGKVSQSAAYLSQQEKGIRVLLLLPAELQRAYEDLRYYPDYIIESLIMSERIDLVHHIIKMFPELRKESVYVSYALKAIFPPPQSSAKSTQWIIKEDNALELRKTHRFHNVPSHKLTKDLLDLCEDSQVVGQTCLILCDQLSEQLNSPDCEKDRLLFVNIIQQLLLYGKYRLENCTEDTFTSIQDCETYLSRVDLLQKLLFSGIDLKYQRISLSTFTDTQKSQQIRDKLIEYDRIELAIEVATKCNVDPVPAWVNWGLTLLKIGKYNEAKEKFRYCMTPTVKEENTEAKISSPRNPLPSNHSILHKIITVLESGAPSKQRELITKYNELKNRIKKPQTARTDPSSPKSAFSFSPSPKQNLIKQHSLDTSRYMQCMYYLQCYGTPDDLVKFWLRHNLIEDALRYILNAQLDVTVFQTVITAVLKTNQLQKFKEILLKIDPTQKKWNNFLLSTCKYFNNSKKYDLLLNFQEFMKDYARAGFTCIKLFAKAEDHQTQIRFLDEAKAYFVKASELEQPVNSPNDINKYMRGVNLQKEVSLFLMGQKNVKPLDITLFGAKDQKTRIAEIVLEMSNFDLAWKIMQEYQLEFTQIYKTAFKALALKKQTQAITNIMKGIRGMMMMEDEDWDELLLIVIGVYMNEGNDKNVAENFVNQLRKPTSKITGLILCKKLNKAYLEAVSTLEKTKSSDLTIIHTISSEARKTGNPHVADLCEQYISSHSN